MLEIHSRLMGSVVIHTYPQQESATNSSVSIPAIKILGHRPKPGKVYRVWVGVCVCLCLCLFLCLSLSLSVCLALSLSLICLILFLWCISTLMSCPNFSHDFPMICYIHIHIYIYIMGLNLLFSGRPGSSWLQQKHHQWKPTRAWRFPAESGVPRPVPWYHIQRVIPLYHIFYHVSIYYLGQN